MPDKLVHLANGNVVNTATGFYRHGTCDACGGRWRYVDDYHRACNCCGRRMVFEARMSAGHHAWGEGGRGLVYVAPVSLEMWYREEI